MIKLFDSLLAGKPDQLLTAILIIVAAVAIWAAFQKSATLKAALATWFVAP